MQILQDVKAANLSVIEQGDIPRGILRASLPVAFGRIHIAPLLSKFMALYPEVKLDLRLSDGLANLVEEDLDLVIRIGNLDRSRDRLILRKLASHTRLVCGSPAYFERHAIPTHPDDLAHHNCLYFTYCTGDEMWRFKRYEEVCEIKVIGSLNVNNSDPSFVSLGKN